MFYNRMPFKNHQNLDVGGFHAEFYSRLKGRRPGKGGPLDVRVFRAIVNSVLAKRGNNSQIGRMHNVDESRVSEIRRALEHKGYDAANPDQKARRVSDARRADANFMKFLAFTDAAKFKEWLESYKAQRESGKSLQEMSRLVGASVGVLRKFEKSLFSRKKKMAMALSSNRAKQIHPSTDEIRFLLGIHREGKYLFSFGMVASLVSPQKPVANRVIGNSNAYPSAVRNPEEQRAASKYLSHLPREVYLERMRIGRLALYRYRSGTVPKNTMDAGLLQ